MAVTVLTGVGVIFAGTDLSDHVREVHIEDGVEEHDDTVMPYVARSALGGLKTPSIGIKFLQDFASPSVHTILQANLNTSIAVIVRRTASAIRSGTNPEWSFTGKYFTYKPIDGQVGALQEPDVMVKSTGTAFTYLTTAT